MSRITDIIVRVRDALSDPDAERWSDNRLLRLIDEGQKNIATVAQCLRTRVNVPIVKQRSLYTVASDVDTITRVLLGGDKVSLRTRAYMDEQFGVNWEYDTSDNVPTEVVYDETNRKTLTVYPIASDLETEEYLADSDFGVTTTITDYESSADYGIAAVLTEPVTEDVIYSSDYGIISIMEEVLSAMMVYYTKVPVTLTATSDELEVDDLFDTALKYFTVGMALRDDLDSQNKELGNEALQFYSAELNRGTKSSSKDHISSSDQHSQGYQPGI